MMTRDDLINGLGLTNPQARYLIDCINGKRDPTRHPAGDRRVRECYYPPSLPDLILHVADAMLGTYGIEGFQLDGESAWISYCNMGATYAVTLCAVSQNGLATEPATLIVSSWGDLIESLEE